MKILVYGAGVLGSVYAARLAAASNDVTLVARGQRLADIRQYGLVLEDYSTGLRTATPINVVQKLSPEESFDLALVIVRKNQLDAVLGDLAGAPLIPDILFMFNNAAGAGEMIRAVGRERVLLGFPGGGGMRDGHVIRFMLSDRSRQPTTIGELDGRISERLMRIAALFESAGFPVDFSENMDAWLKTHVAVISPIANAIYATGCDRLRLARTRDALVLMVRAVREGLSVLQGMGIPITPSRMRALLWIPEPLLVWYLQRGVTSELFELGVVRHATDARDEMEHLSGEFRFLARVVGASTPSIDYLASFFDEANPPMPDGKTDLSLNWGAVWRGLAIIALLGVVASWLRKRS